MRNMYFSKARLVVAGALLITVGLMGLTRVIVSAYPTSSAGSTFYLIPITQTPAVSYIGSDAVMSFTSYIDRANSTIPADGLSSVYLKRYFWVENASGTRIPDNGTYFGNRTSGNGAETTNSYPYGLHEAGALVPSDGFCVTKTGAPSGGCPDTSRKDDVYRTSASLPVGYKVCSMALVVAHFGRPIYGSVYPPLANESAATDPFGDADGYADLWQNGALPISAAYARSQQSSMYGASEVKCFEIPPVTPPSSSFRVEPRGTVGTPTLDGSNNVTIQFTSAVDKTNGSTSIPAQGIKNGVIKRYFYITAAGDDYANSGYSDDFTGMGSSGAIQPAANGTWEVGSATQNQCFSQNAANAPSCGLDQSTATDTFTIPAANAPAGARVCMRVILRYHIGTVAADGTATPTNSAHSNGFSMFSIPASGLAAANSANSVAVLSAPICATVPSPPVVLANPYFRVVGGDVLAGSGTFEGPTCTVTANAPIAAFNKGGPAYLGAAVQFASYATGRVTQFATAYQRTATPQVPRGLAFANTNGGNEYGGEVGNTPCAPDYYAQNTLTTTNWINSYTTGTYYSNGNVNLTSATIPNGQRVVLYVNGDARISGNIVYANGGWSTATQIPSFYLIVRGNIYIDNNVSQLDGAYIAQQTAANTKGIIYTCTVAGAVPTAVQIANPTLCGQTRLDVNGAFIGRQIKLLRTRGDLTTCTDLNSCQNSVAESFNYSPDVWLSAPLTGVTAAGGYDSITSLPPVL